jgi:hypothetical protein
MGEVYLARDTRLDRPVALKLLNPVLADDEGFRERLLRESRLAAGLDHPNVIPIYDAGEADGRLVLPQLVDHPVGRDEAVGLRQEDDQHPPLPRSPEPGRVPVDQRLNRSQEAVVDRHGARP